MLPSRLAGEGPLIGLLFSPATNNEPLDSSLPHEVVTGLIDTGATFTSISNRLAERLELIPIDTITSVGAHGEPVNCFIYSVDIRPVGSYLVLNSWRVSSCDLHGSSFDALIGRDILSLAHFSYDGAQASFSITVPSLNHPMCEIPTDLSTQSPEKNPKEKKSSFKKRKDIQKESRKRNRNK